MKINCNHLIFVYGSMKKSFINHFRLETAYFLGNAITKEKYAMYPSESYKFPYVLEEEKKFHIKGELYSICNDLMDILDIFEGHPVHYIRKTVNVVINDVILEANIYFRASSNPSAYDKTVLIDKWTTDLEYLGYKECEDELINIFKNFID